jgi:hypothetical protein
VRAGCRYRLYGQEDEDVNTSGDHDDASDGIREDGSVMAEWGSWRVGDG